MRDKDATKEYDYIFLKIPLWWNLGAKDNILQTSVFKITTPTDVHDLLTTISTPNISPYFRI